ncbi:hypothetical protein ACFV98_24805 [Streptomyces violascens]|uniref:hypothetical protein n=1 Tax=Streptomyces violascens TaxID=67381 RepID=UPI0036540374
MSKQSLRPRGAWLAELVAVTAGVGVTLGLILGLGWGQDNDWRLLAATAVGLGVTTVSSELPIALARRERAMAAAHMERYKEETDAVGNGRDD